MEKQPFSFCCSIHHPWAWLSARIHELPDLFLTRADKVISGGGSEVRIQAALSNEEKTYTDVTGAGENGFRIIMASDCEILAVRGTICLHPVEEVYGFGEMWNGHVAQRGQSFDIWDKPGSPNECAYMPYYVSTHNSTFLLNDGGRVHFDIGQSNACELSFQAPASCMDMTLASGKSVASAV